MLSARRQKGALSKLLAELPVGDVVLCYDWKEKVWHTQERFALALCGAVVEATIRPRGLCTRTISKSLTFGSRQRRRRLRISCWIKCLRRQECFTFGATAVHITVLAHYVSLCQQRRQRIRISLFGEQHGKSVLDTAFGQMTESLQRYSLVKPVLCKEDLLQAYQSGASQTMKADPNGPRWQFSSQPGSSRTALWRSPAIAAELRGAHAVRSQTERCP